MIGKPYHITKYQANLGSYLVFSTSYERLDYHLNDIAQRLKAINYKGRVIIDLLLSNGNSKNRFVEMIFDGTEFELKKTKSIKANTELEKISISFYNKHSDILENSTLTKAQLFLIRKGSLKAK